MKIIRKICCFAVVLIMVVSMCCLSTLQIFADYDNLDKSSLKTTLYWDTSYDNGQYTNYRLPSIAVSKANTVIVYGEARNTNINIDNGGKNHDECLMDLYIRRSTDGGATFGEPIYIARGHDYYSRGLGETLNNPVMFVGNDGILHMLFSCNVARAGMFYTRSTDDGLTWSEPRDISGNFKGVNYIMLACGPGHGVCLDDGRLVTSAWMYNGAYYVYPIYSDDNGETWKIGQRVSTNRDETCIVRTSDGGVLCNSRQNALPSETAPYRVLSSSLNGIGAWTTSEAHTTLIDPACCGGMTSVELEGLPHAILFSNNASTTTRNNLTVRCSFDDGLTWEKSIVIDKQNGGYSDIAVDQNGKVYVIYEQAMGTKVMLATFGYYEAFCAGDDDVKSQQKDFTDVAQLAEKPSGVKFTKNTSGALKATVENENEPSFTLDISSKSKAVNLSDSPVLALRLKASGEGDYSSFGLFFRSGRIDESVSKLYTEFKVKNDGEEHTVLIDLSDRDAYRGNLYSLEIECFTMDEAAQKGDSLQILQLGFYESEEAALKVYPEPDAPEEQETTEPELEKPDNSDDIAINEDEGGCGSSIAVAPVIMALPLAFAVRKRRKK